MPSRLEKMVSTVRRACAENGCVVFPTGDLEDLLAVVDAARSIADDSFPGSTNDDYRALQKALARLDEEQP
jgi:hypothetical protein